LDNGWASASSVQNSGNLISGGSYTHLIRMPNKFLVAYATKHGSTAEIADAVGAALREEGHLAEVMPVINVTNTAQFDAIVIGTPIYTGKILKETVRFVQTHQMALHTKPVFVFVVGQSLKDPDTGAVAKADAALGPVRDLINVRETGYFGGKIDRANLPVIGFFVKRGVKVQDYRDWDRIRTWAKGLAIKVKPGNPSA
jgi:menaquinone-dependent protoporphyrinogen oxidase